VTVLIVGAGLAGIRTAECLRERGFDGSIVLVGDETERPYDRPPLSKQVLRGEKEPFYLLGDLDVELRLGVAAEGLSLPDKTVLTSAGPVTFDQLVIATGAHPRRLPGEPGVVLRTLSDARGLGALLGPGVRLAIVGAGLIGCEVAASARQLGAHVEVVDLLAGPLVRLLGPAVSHRVQDLHESHGVRFHLNAGVLSADHDRLAFSDGIVLEADVILEAMGVTPAVEWLTGSGLDLSDGVVCDDSGQAAEGVWACGDVARWGQAPRFEHWTSASEQGASVAAALLGGEPSAVPVPYWWSDQYDVKLQGLGVPAAEDDVVMVEVGARQRPLALYSREGLVTGVVGFSAGAAVMGLREAVASNAPLAAVLDTLS